MSIPSTSGRTSPTGSVCDAFTATSTTPDADDDFSEAGDNPPAPDDRVILTCSYLNSSDQMSVNARKNGMELWPTDKTLQDAVEDILGLSEALRLAHLQAIAAFHVEVECFVKRLLHESLAEGRGAECEMPERELRLIFTQNRDLREIAKAAERSDEAEQGKKAGETTA